MGLTEATLKYSITTLWSAVLTTLLIKQLQNITTIIVIRHQFSIIFTSAHTSIVGRLLFSLDMVGYHVQVHHSTFNGLSQIYQRNNHKGLHRSSPGKRNN